ncbi:hypothetical protein AB1Y20_008153 [Prymnesium parvum]|uniref:Myosin-1 n=1 Tax=Prymnesium parvum TaxID=97485 RepID=A0AB34ITK3_PRYPA
MVEWFYVDASGSQQGPASASELLHKQRNGSIHGDTFVWNTSLPEWTPLKKVRELQAPPAPAAAQAPPAPAAARAPRSVAAPRPAAAGGGWKVRMTVDGGKYYHNTATDEVSWDKPHELQSPEERQNDTSDCVWLPSEEEGGWVAAYVVKRTAKAVTARPVDGGATVEVAQGGKGNKPLTPLKLSHLERRNMHEDLVLLEALDPALIAYCLRYRYSRDEIYTWVGADHSVLISVNPFKRLGIYGARQLEAFAAPSPNKLQPPHTYAIANAAYKALATDRASQSILISGESGAGKTEATKQCLSFLAEANPVLEAFGNAKTLRNDNSSRFGRWMEVHFHSSGMHEGSIAGAFVENYLLEKSRVVAQMQKGERSYHIFYQLCCSPWAAALSLPAADSFAYLSSSGCTSVQGVDDAAEFEQAAVVLSALSGMAFSQEDIQWAFSLCAAVLHLGNIRFMPTDAGEGSAVDTRAEGQQALGLAAYYLNVDGTTLAAALVERQVVIRGELQCMRNNTKAASEAVEALAKAVYSALFDDLVRRINMAVGGERGNAIGVLDIFGFEIFKTNSFEQLCINFTNERLQQKFNQHTFTQEESLYLAEGVEFAKVPFIDNQPVLELLSSKPYGLLNLLDEEVRVPQGGDIKWVEKCAERHATSKMYGGPGVTQVNYAFLVRHYAGEVTYDCRGMVEKNADRLSRNLYQLLSEAAEERTKLLFPPKDEKALGAKASTVGEKFRSQLNKLMQRIEATHPFFIRCIKPNQAKAPNKLEMKMVIEQMTYAGVFEAVKIRKGGYPFRCTHAAFAHKYRWIARKAHGWVPINASPTSSPAEFCHAVLSSVHQDFSQVRIGKTLVLYRAEEHRVLELLKNLALGRVFQHMQASFRRKMGRTYRRLLRAAMTSLGSALAAIKACAVIGDVEVRQMEVALQQYHDTLGRFGAIFSAYVPREYEEMNTLKNGMAERLEVHAEAQQCLAASPPNLQTVAGLMARYDALAQIGATHDQAQVESAVRQLYENTVVAFDREAAEALRLVDRKSMESVLARAQQYNYNTPDLYDISEKLQLKEEDFVQMQLKTAVKMNDPTRIISREIALKKIFLEQHGASFVLSKCPALHPPAEWAAGSWFGNKRDLAEGMLTFTATPIHKSLTNFDKLALEPRQQKEHAKEAVSQFKNLLAFIGERKVSHPEDAASDWLRCGAEMPDLRLELFMQLMKQINGNPDDGSVKRVFVLLFASLMHFAPPNTIENFLAAFLRNNVQRTNARPEKVMMLLHTSMYRGAKPLATSFSVSDAMDKFSRMDVAGAFAGEDTISAASSRAAGAPPPASAAAKAPAPRPVQSNGVNGHQAPAGPSRARSGSFNNVWCKRPSGDGSTWKTGDDLKQDGVEWFYVDAGGAQQGPTSSSQLQTMWQTGAIGSRTFAWHAALPEWTPIESIPELAPAAQSKPPAKASPPPSASKPSSTPPPPTRASPSRPPPPAQPRQTAPPPAQPRQTPPPPAQPRQTPPPPAQPRQTPPPPAQPRQTPPAPSQPRQTPPPPSQPRQTPPPPRQTQTPPPPRQTPPPPSQPRQVGHHAALAPTRIQSQPAPGRAPSYQQPTAPSRAPSHPQPRANLPPPPSHSRPTQNPQAALLADTQRAVAYLKGQVANAQQMGASDAASQWQQYLQTVQTLEAQLPTGGPQIASTLKQCIDQLGLQQTSGVRSGSILHTNAL